MNLDALLTSIEQTFYATRKDYRDRMIQVGGMISDYLLQRLKQGDDLNEHHRRKQGIVRSVIIGEVANRLKISSCKVNELIRIAHVCRLLFPNGYGDLSYCTLRSMRKLIHRSNRGKERQRNKNRKGEGVLVSEIETWTLRTEKAVEVAKEAVANTHTDKEVQVAILQIPDCTRTPYVRSIHKKAISPTILPASNLSSIVEQITKLLLAVDDPEKVLSKVRENLAFLPIARETRQACEIEHEERLKAYEQAAKDKKPIFQKERV